MAKHTRPTNNDFGIYFKGKKPIRIILLAVLLCIVAFAAGVGISFYKNFNASSDDIKTEVEKSLDQDSPEFTMLKEQGRFNVLVLGEDDVEGSRRSDTILFVSVNLTGKNIRIISIPRDTQVEIPGRKGYHKVNSAFAFGGPELLKQTVQNYLSEPIKYYVVINYDNFPKLIDAVGGVDIDVKKKMRYVDKAGHLDININAGQQHMDGITALHFVRFRKDALGDIGRVQRQQQFIKALLKKVYDPRVIIKIPEIIRSLFSVFDTNMKTGLAVQLAGFVKNELTRDKIFMSTLHGEAVMVNKLSFWQGNVTAAKSFINASLDELNTGSKNIGEKRSSEDTPNGYEFAYSSAGESENDNAKNENPDNTGSTTNNGENGAKKSVQDNSEIKELIRSMQEPVAVLNGSGEAGIGDKVAQKLKSIGIDVIRTGNAKHFDYNYSNVVYPVNANASVKDSAIKLGKILKIPDSLVRPNKQAFDASIIVGHDHKELIKTIESLSK